MAKSLTFILVALMALALMIFTASRTLDLLQLLLPANQSVFAFLGLVAFDGGLFGWSMFFAYGARGAYQRAIALLMVVLSLIAIGVSVVADLMISASSKGLVTALSEQQRLAILLAVGAIVFLNVAAFFLTHITEPGRLRAMAEESANDRIHAEALKAIERESAIVAARLAPIKAQAWVESIMAQHLGGASLPALSPANHTGKVLDAKENAGASSDLSATVHLPVIAPLADKMPLTIEALTLNPNISDDDLANFIGVKKPASARYFRQKAQEFLDRQKGGSQNGALPFPHS